MRWIKVPDIVRTPYAQIITELAKDRGEGGVHDKTLSTNGQVGHL